jgi:hypothetical protein
MPVTAEPEIARPPNSVPASADRSMERGIDPRDCDLRSRSACPTTRRPPPPPISSWPATHRPDWARFPSRGPAQPSCIAGPTPVPTGPLRQGRCSPMSPASGVVCTRRCRRVGAPAGRAVPTQARPRPKAARGARLASAFKKEKKVLTRGPSRQFV